MVLKVRERPGMAVDAWHPSTGRVKCHPQNSTGHMNPKAGTWPSYKVFTGYAQAQHSINLTRRHTPVMPKLEKYKVILHHIRG